MDDSELDFVDLCSKLLKRVRKKEPGRPRRKGEQQSSSQATRGEKRTVDKQDEDSLSGFSATGSEVVCGGTGRDSGDAVQSSAFPPAEADLRAKDKVLLRMQEFKRASPQKMIHSNRVEPAKTDDYPLTAQHQKSGNATIIPTQTSPCKLWTWCWLFNALLRVWCAVLFRFRPRL